MSTEANIANKGFFRGPAKEKPAFVALSGDGSLLRAVAVRVFELITDKQVPQEFVLQKLDLNAPMNAQIAAITDILRQIAGNQIDMLAMEALGQTLDLKFIVEITAQDKILPARRQYGNLGGREIKLRVHDGKYAPFIMHPKKFANLENQDVMARSGAKISDRMAAAKHNLQNLSMEELLELYIELLPNDKHLYLNTQTLATYHDYLIEQLIQQLCLDEAGYTYIKGA